MSSETLEFLRLSQAAEERRRQRRQRRLASIVAASVLAAAVMALLFVQARAQRNRARTGALAVQSRLQQADQLDLALLLALEVDRRGDSFEAKRLLYEGLESSPRLETLLRGHADDIRAVAWSPDGLMVATGGGEEPALLLWDIGAEHPEPRPWPGAESGLWSLDWSADGQWLAAGAVDGAVLLWPAAGPPSEPRRLLDAGESSSTIYALRFSPDSRTLAIARADNARTGPSIQLIDVVTGQVQPTVLRGAEDQIRSVAWSPDGAVVAAASLDKDVHLWSAESGEPVVSPLSGHSEGVLSVAWSPDGKTLASASLDGSVGLWDLNEERAWPERQHQRLHPQLGALTSVAWTEPSMLAIAGRDGRASFWSVDGLRRRPLGTLAKGQRAALLAAAWRPDGAALASGNGKTLVLWRSEPAPRLATSFDLEHQGLRRVAASPDGALIAASGQQRLSGQQALQLWHRPSGQQRHALQGLKHPQPELVWGATASMLHAATSDRTVSHIEISSGRLLDQWPLTSDAEGRVVTLAWSADGSYLALGLRDGTVELWETGERRLIATAPAGSEERLLTLAWSPDAARLAGGARDGSVIVWNAGDGTLLRRQPSGHEGAVRSLAWSPDGEILTSGGDDQSVRLWSTASSQALGEPLGGHGEAVLQLSWSDDGTTLAAATNERTILLWDVERRAPFATLRGHSETITALFFAAGDTTLVSVDLGGTLINWEVDMESWRDRACDLARRNLSDPERRLYLPYSQGLETCRLDSNVNQWRAR